MNSIDAQQPNNFMEEEEELSNNFMEEEAAEEYPQFNPSPEFLEKLQEEKARNPGMFVSAWQDDDVGIEKDENDPIEDFLTSAEEGKLDTVKQKLEENPSLINAKDKDGYTALHRACYENRIDVISYLLEHGADVEATTNDGWTPLLSAANWANYEAIGRLLSHGVNANATSNGNVSALHLAIRSTTNDLDNIFHCVRYLLEAPGIDAGIVSGAGDTPIALARRSNRAVYELLSDFLSR